VQHTIEKLLTRAIILLQTSSQGLHAKLWGLTVAKIPTLRISRLPFGSPETKMSFRCGPHGKA